MGALQATMTSNLSASQKTPCVFDNADPLVFDAFKGAFGAVR